MRLSKEEARVRLTRDAFFAMRRDQHKAPEQVRAAQCAWEQALDARGDVEVTAETCTCGMEDIPFCMVDHGDGENA